MKNEDKDLEKDVREELEIEKKIFESAKELDIPESLRPDNVERMLEAKKKEKDFRWKRIYTATAAAACCALIVGAAMYGGVFDKQETPGSDTASSQQVEAQTANEGQTGAKTTKAESNEGSSAGAMIASAKDYKEVYEYIKAEADLQNQDSTPEAYVTDEIGGAAKSTQESAADSTGNTAAAGIAYSDTNVREAGVEEADIVKTDGKQLYIVNGQKVQIVNIEKKEMQEMGTIRLGKDQYVTEIYVKDGKLILVYTRTDYEDGNPQYGGLYKQYTVAETYDVSEPQNPKSIGKVTQSGNYYSMRVNGDFVYLLSSFYADTAAKQDDIAAYIPEVQGKAIDSSKILLPQYERGNQYTVISGFSMKDPEKKVDSKAVFGGTGQIYVSQKNIYLNEAYYNGEESKVTQTCIRKISYENGSIQAVGQTKINGTLNDSFSIDEYEGKLRLVTTISYTGNNVPYPIMRVGDSSPSADTNQKDNNCLYILDETLNEIGKIDGLAEDESVYSARFMGEVGYFVTFRQVDPLFSVDLSDPKNPKILGKLKIPGFSEYLHPYGDGLLLGIGMDVDATGVTTNGVKLSMFDISNPSKVREVQKKVIENCFATNVAGNYKSAMIDVEKNLIGFSGYGEGQHYYIFSYDKESSFRCVFDREISGTGEARGLYVEDRFYLTTGNTVESFEMEKFEKVDDIVL